MNFRERCTGGASATVAGNRTRAGTAAGAAPRKLGRSSSKGGRLRSPTTQPDAKEKFRSIAPTDLAVESGMLRCLRAFRIGKIYVAENSCRD